MRDITITMPEGQADYLLHFLKEILDKKERKYHWATMRPTNLLEQLRQVHLDDDGLEQLEAEIALLTITIAQLEGALS